jgi:tRNA-uridine 2-sulfurtransferase
MKVLVAMSGGVDSSVAAALMVEEGHDVLGVTLKLWSGPDGEMPTAGCCTLADSEDARRVAAKLGIPYYVLDYTEDFRDGVVDRFVRDYTSGRTPNPCIECNRTVKFDRLLRRLAEFDRDVLVTGHHARVTNVGSRWELLRGTDRAKDQSYVLSMLSQEQLAVTRLPVGEMTKARVREVAAELGLRTADKEESMDICFVGHGDYRGFLQQTAPESFRPGPVVDTGGNVVAEHDGIAGFTIGQRRGLGVAVGEPRYVVDIDPNRATVVIGRRRDLQVGSIELVDVTRTASDIRLEGGVAAQYRAHGEPVPAVLAGSTLVFEDLQEGVAPGQTVAFYSGDRVLGGAVIAATGR